MNLIICRVKSWIWWLIVNTSGHWWTLVFTVKQCRWNCIVECSLLNECQMQVLNLFAWLLSNYCQTRMFDCCHPSTVLIWDLSSERVVSDLSNEKCFDGAFCLTKKAWIPVSGTPFLQESILLILSTELAVTEGVKLKGSPAYAFTTWKIAACRLHYM